jgi:O-antigen ligase
MSKVLDFFTKRLIMSNNLSYRNYYILLSIVAANTVFLIVFPGLVSFTVFSLSIIGLFCFSPFMPLIFWIFLLPFESHLRQQALISPFYALVLLISVYVIMFTLIEQFKIHWLPALFAIVVITISSFSLFYSDNVFVSVRNIISLSTVLMVFYAIAIFMKQSDKSFFFITIDLFISSAFAMLFSLITTSRGYRFSLFDNVRSISNVLGISIVVGVIYLFKKISAKRSDDKTKLFGLEDIGVIVYVLLMSVFLLFTVSRGVVLAVVVALLFFIAYLIITNFSTKTLKRVLIFSLIFIAFIYVLSFSPVFSIIGWDTIVMRFSQNFAENVRLEFWLYALQKLAENHLLFGIGLANFESFISEGGYSFYSHSVFIDFIVSTGLVGVISIAMISLKLLSDIIKEKNFLSLTILIYTFVSFSTHGTIFSKFFWLSLALIIGLLSNEKS